MLLYQWCEGIGGDAKYPSLTGLHFSDSAHETWLDVVLFFVGKALKFSQVVSEMNRVVEILSVCGLWWLPKQPLLCQRWSSWENVGKMAFHASLLFGGCDTASIAVRRGDHLSYENGAELEFCCWAEWLRFVILWSTFDKSIAWTCFLLSNRSEGFESAPDRCSDRLLLM